MAKNKGLHVIQNFLGVQNFKRNLRQGKLSYYTPMSNLRPENRLAGSAVQARRTRNDPYVL